jgi:two-component system OmpR family sensor kinase
VSWSLRRRLTASAIVGAAVLLVGAIALLHVGARRALWQQHDTALLARARGFASLAEHDDDGYELKLPPPSVSSGAPLYVEAWQPDGRVLVRSPALGTADLARSASDGEVLRDTVLPDGRPGRAAELHFVPRDEGVRERAGAVTVVLAEGIDDVEDALASARRWFVIVAAVGLSVLAAYTAWVVRRALAPLARLAHAIERIDARQLATRLPVDAQARELAAPIAKLNELLERLESAFERERQFTADVSHELRTPIAGLRTMLEVTAAADRTLVEHRAVVADALLIVNQLAALIENLLQLARLDAGEVRLEVCDVKLRELVDECWRLHAATAQARALRFANKVPPEAWLATDREKLRIVISNLLANAAEYTEHGGWIEVASTDPAVIAVRDSGPPIPPQQLAQMFDRLWRGDAARTTTGVHCGIGLSLSRALCVRLGMSLDAATRSDGSVELAVTSPNTGVPAHRRLAE